MPNHVHGIVLISGDDSMKVPTGDLPVAPTGRARGPGRKSISSLVAGFKAAATRMITRSSAAITRPLWQRNYYEHVIRNEVELQKLREYVLTNPARWSEDSLFPENQAPSLGKRPQ